MKNFFTWLITSSADPDAVSLTVKGALVYGVSIIMQFAPLACSLVAALCFDTSVLSPAVDAIVGIIHAILVLISLCMVLYGLGRKIWLGRWAHPAAVQ